MDINGANGITGAGMGQQEMPLGFGFALAANEPAMKGYAALTEAEKVRRYGFHLSPRNPRDASRGNHYERFYKKSQRVQETWVECAGNCRYIK